VTRRASPRLGAYAALTALGLLGALALHRPELAVLAAPFATLLAVGVLLDRPPAVSARLQLERDRALEREELPLELIVAASAPVERLEALVALPDGLELTEGGSPPAVRLGREERVLPLRLRCARWGAYALADVHLRSRDPIGLFTWEWQLERSHRLRVFPQPEHVRTLLAPLETQAFAGNQVARLTGDGLEFADTRLFVPGDRLRSINWRASARRCRLVVNELHPERNTDVVLFLDSFAEAGLRDESTLDRAVRAVSALALRYLERRDRVGLVTYGAVLRWLTPGSGPLQRYRLLEALLETEVELSYAWRDVDVLPARTLPPKALVIAVTPLLDPRAIGALIDLRARGRDVAVVEVSPVPFAQPGASELARLAYRLWLLRREELRARLERLGIAVGRWSDDATLEPGLEGVRTYRRHAALARRAL
jgi:uncharacterized protein (DUF58 family)